MVAIAGWRSSTVPLPTNSLPTSTHAACAACALTLSPIWAAHPISTVFDRVLERIERLGWHVVLHLDAQDILQYADRIARIKVPFVIDHMGRVRAEGGLDQKPFLQLLELMRNPLAWVKVCGSERVSIGRRPFDDAIPFARALIDAAPDRVLWGTDWPHPNISKDMPNDGELVDLMFRFCPDPELRDKLLVKNPERLYG